MHDIFLKCQNAEGSQLAVDGNQLAEIVYDDLTINELQPIEFAMERWGCTLHVKKLGAESLVYSPLNVNLRL